MISVLIPTHNWDVYQLVSGLHKQLVLTNIQFEIIIVDDASNTKFSGNDRLHKLSNTSFEILNKNIGRSAIRNYLARKAKYSWLLFLDGDVIPAQESFIENYLNFINEKKNVIVGGIKYEREVTERTIRWKLGKRNEEKDVRTREADRYKYFFTGNFLIQKKVFDRISFDQSLTKYGYEDLLFAKELQKQEISIEHMENEVYHLGIDSDELYLSKTKEALENLSQLLVGNHLNFDDTKITKFYKRVWWLCLPYFLSFFTDRLEQITIKKSSLFYFNLFRIGYLSRMIEKLQ
ncbi:glycosyltransferase family 2 protein [Tenacibaculum xiamenense]|uniref:glycosyltransferase family 2 protein n=1 Tax=Tenacibaculum xiamenense TaxID=1261553 RepID=UPI003892F564